MLRGRRPGWKGTSHREGQGAKAPAPDWPPAGTVRLPTLRSRTPEGRGRIQGVGTPSKAPGKVPFQTHGTTGPAHGRTPLDARKSRCGKAPQNILRKFLTRFPGGFTFLKTFAGPWQSETAQV